LLQAGVAVIAAGETVDIIDANLSLSESEQYVLMLSIFFLPISLVISTVLLQTGAGETILEGLYPKGLLF